MSQEVALILAALVGGGGVGAIVKAFFDNARKKETIKTDKEARTAQSEYDTLVLQINTYQKQVEQLSNQEHKCLERVTKLENSVDSLRIDFEKEDREHKIEVEAHRHLKHRSINLLTSHEGMLKLIKASLVECPCNLVNAEHNLFFHRTEIHSMILEWEPRSHEILTESDRLLKRFLEDQIDRQH